MGNKCVAVEFYEKSLKIQETLPSPNYSSMSVMYYNAASMHRELENHEAALKHAERSVETARLAFGPDHTEVKENQMLVDRIRNKS
ncbi:unnamed protein product [Rotaria magnacalcarata]|nr:unnamed protein product [Rotaria magnacalcarata]CAF3842901.1 unnamed protein product [Rotaria magnacalcarata]